jgi:hypothetical protein
VSLVDDLLKQARREEYKARAKRNGTCETGEPEDQSAIANGVKVKRRVIPFTMSQIMQNIRMRLDDWPRRVGTALFVPDGTTGISWLESTAALFGYMGMQTGTVKWFKGAGCHTKEEVYAEQRRTATRYDAVELLPHCPPLPGHYYACETPSPGEGKTLRALVGRFNPATDIDAALLEAGFVTAVVWGGRGGTKPAITVTSDAGRGTGKTTYAKMVGHLAGGIIELSTNDSAETIKQRLLSPEGLTKRVVLLDNVKSLRFSWAELEALITCPVISGKRMYVGEGTRPNTLTWFVTLNGVSLAADMAQRSIIVKLNKPAHSGEWEEETYRFIDANRQALIADCLGFFQREPAKLTKFSRWGAWERDILARLPDPDETQKVILERQGQADVEQEEHDIIEEYFRRELTKLEYQPAEDAVFIPSGVAAEWYNLATKTRQGTIAAGRILSQAIDEGKLKYIRRNHCLAYGRGFVWWGEATTSANRILTDLQEQIDYHYAKSKEERSESFA